MSTDDGRGEIGLVLVWSLNRLAIWSAQATYEGPGPVRGPWAGTRAVGNKRAVGKKEGRGPVRRPVGKKEGRGHVLKLSVVLESSGLRPILGIRIAMATIFITV